jgi:hypothetical protein
MGVKGLGCADRLRLPERGDTRVDRSGVHARVSRQDEDGRAAGGQLDEKGRIVGTGDAGGDACGSGGELDALDGIDDGRGPVPPALPERVRQIGASDHEGVDTVDGRDLGGGFDAERGLDLDKAEWV